jgi:hypothetical protein
MKTTQNNYHGVTYPMVALVMVTILLSLSQVSLAQTPNYWGLPPVNVNPSPIVNEMDGQASFDGEWNQADWMPDLAPYNGTYYGQIIANWIATASNPANQTMYPGNTMLEMHDLSDLVSQDLWDYNTFQITVNGERITGWIFGNDNNPDNLDYLWIGGSGIGYSSIDDRGFLVRKNDDMTTDIHWFPGDPEPGDPNFDWDTWYGFFGSYGFNNSAWLMGLPNTTNGANEVYELAYHGPRAGMPTPVSQINFCWIIQNVTCDVGGNELINGTHTVSCGHAVPIDPTFAGVDIVAIFQPNSNVPYNSGIQALQLTFHNEHTMARSGVAQLTSSHGFNITPASVPYSLSPGQTMTIPITVDVPPAQALINSLDTLRVTSEDYTSYNCMRITDAPSQLELNITDVTVMNGTMLPVGCTAVATPGKMVMANPVWSMTGGIGNIAPVTGSHVPACVAFARANFTSPGSGWIIVTQGALRDSAHVTVVSPQNMDVNIAAVNPPVVIPANGGSFQYNLNAHNLTTTPQTFQIWNKIKTQIGTYVPVFGPITRTLPGGANPTRMLTQSVAGSIPPGVCTYISYIGTYPSTIQDSSFFNFTKSAIADGNPWVSNYNTYGDLFEEYSSNSNAPLPSELALNASPNPFNPTTTLTFTLPEAGNVNLAIYDVAGRLVAELANGYRDAGSHQETFDASRMASGVYIVRLESANQSALQKIVLMK